MMVGQKVDAEHRPPRAGRPASRAGRPAPDRAQTPRASSVLDDVSFTVYGGEILGIAGISGSGQKELLEAIAGLQPTESGASIRVLRPRGATHRCSSSAKRPMAHPRDGHRASPSCRRTAWAWAWSARMGMTDNMMLQKLRQGPFAHCRPQEPRTTLAETHQEGAGRRHARHEHPRARACPAATCRRCWWAAKSPPTPPC